MCTAILSFEGFFLAGVGAPYFVSLCSVPWFQAPQGLSSVLSLSGVFPVSSYISPGLSSPPPFRDLRLSKISTKCPDQFEEFRKCMDKTQMKFAQCRSEEKAFTDAFNA